MTSPGDARHPKAPLGEMMRPALSLLAVLFVRDAAALVVTVTHAAGRMGVSVVGQLRESGQLSGEEEELGIRAVVRNEREASRLKLDLCGAVLRNGELRLMGRASCRIGVLFRQTRSKLGSG